MSSFLRYPHLERFGNVEVEDIHFGTCHIFPKLDGTNASVWFSNKELKFGSRNRELSLEKDNHGFAAAMSKEERLLPYFEKYPRHRLYGEWLVPHSFTEYDDDAWKTFYIFDVYDDELRKFIPYEEYQPLLEEFQLDYIPCFWRVSNINEERLQQYAMECRFLLKPEAKCGEGVVLKNYAWINQYGRTTWAKLITSEFKTKHIKVMGPVEYENHPIEAKLVDLAITVELVEKEYAKIQLENNGWSSKYIPRLLETIFYCVVTEELWNALKKLNFPIVNFKSLRQFCIQKTKQLKPDLF